MALQYSIALRSSRANWHVSLTANGGEIRIYGGTKPATCDALANGPSLTELYVASGPLLVNTNGVLSLASAATGNVGSGVVGTVIATHYRIYSDGGAAFEQGTITATGGGGDMTLDNVNFTANMPVTITAYTSTEPNA